MATKVYLIPEVGFVQVPDGGSREYLIPEGGFFSEGAESTTVNVSATCASLILTDNNATVTVESNISASCAALLLSTLAASITGAINVPATCAALTLTTLPATVDGSSVILVDATTAAMILTSNPAVVSLPVNVAGTCAVALLRTKYADVSVESHAVIETGWAKERGLGPWEFNKPPKKYGYINNPRFVNKDEATEIHKPCGYWPLVYSEIGWYQQMVAVDSSRKLIGASMISQDNAQYKLMYYNYETDSIIKEVDFSTEGVLLNTYYGATLLFDKADGEPRILYLNYEDTNLCSYAYDYNGRMTNLVIDTAVSIDYRTQGVYLGSGMIVVANMKDSNSYSYTSDDYGNSWSSGTLIVAGSPVTFCYDGASRIYAAYTVFDDSQPFRVKYSTNAGSTWISMDGLPDSPEAYATGVLFAASGSNLLAYYEADGTVYFIYSVNQGASWGACTLPVVAGDTTILIGTIFLCGDYGIAHGYGSDTGTGYVLQSVDAGVNWSVATNPSFLTDYNVPLVEKNTPVEFNTDGIVYTSTFCGYAIAPGDLAFQISFDNGVSWMQRSLHIGADTVNYGPNPVWNMPGGTN